MLAHMDNKTVISPKHKTGFVINVIHRARVHGPIQTKHS